MPLIVKKGTFQQNLREGQTCQYKIGLLFLKGSLQTGCRHCACPTPATCMDGGDCNVETMAWDIKFKRAY